jgi:HD-GYP domain-containing protein (c-di-GMP phosphodiesterase class II)
MGITGEALIHLRRGALLHDIGKLGIPDEILNKPGPLDNQEWQLMKEHPEYARKMLSQIEFLHPALIIPYHHHENWDGSGYPQGLQGNQIPLEARIFAVIDVWDALTSNRPYRDAWAEEKAVKYIIEQSGLQFDPDVVEKWIEVFDIPDRLKSSAVH